MKGGRKRGAGVKCMVRAYWSETGLLWLEQKRCPISCRLAGYPLTESTQLTCFQTHAHTIMMVALRGDDGCGSASNVVSRRRSPSPLPSLVGWSACIRFLFSSYGPAAAPVRRSRCSVPAELKCLQDLALEGGRRGRQVARKQRRSSLAVSRANDVSPVFLCCLFHGGGWASFSRV